MKTNTSSALVFLVCVNVANTAYGAMHDDFLKPYAGVDLGYKTQKLEKDYGGNIFKKNYPIGNVYVGTKLNEHFGVELGMERSTNKRSDVSLMNGDIGLGIPVIDGTEPVVIKSKSHYSGWHLGLAANYPVMHNKKLSVIGNAGVKRASVKLERDIVAATGIIPPDAPITAKLSQTKTLMRLAGGMQYFFNEHIGARVLATWENSSKLNPTGLTSRGTLAEAKLKNSIGYYLGIVVK